MQDNIIATIIFIIAIMGLIALVVYKLRKENNNEKVTVEGFLGLYHENLFNVLQDVVSLLSIDIDDFETKEDYERTIISTTIAKLEENCDEFGISSTLLNLVDREVLTNVLYDILYTNKVQIFFSTLPEKIIKSKPELYDNEVIEAFENAEPVLNEDENTHTEPQEELKHEEEEVTKQEEAATDVSNSEKDEEVKAEAEVVNEEVTALPPREAYYGEKKEPIEVAKEDIFFEVLENFPTCLDRGIEPYSEFQYSADIEESDKVESQSPENFDDDPVAETVKTESVNMPAADVDSAAHSIRATLIKENIDHK